MLKYKYKSCGISDIGTVKSVNQDSLYRQNGKYNGSYLLFAMVADGMGGLDAGEVASKMLTDNFNDWFHKGGLEEVLNGDILQFDNILQESIGNVISSTNDQINTYAKESKIVTGSTATMLLLLKGTYYAANIGDSRIYRLTDGNLYQITIDHSWMQQQLDLGYTEGEILEDPLYDELRNRITRCVGAGMEYAYADYFANDYKPGDMFLLCSDGLIHTNSVDEITEILQDEKLNLEDKIEILIDTAKDRGEEDNITAILIEVFEDTTEEAAVSKETPKEKKSDENIHKKTKNDKTDETEELEEAPQPERITQTLE